MRMFCLFILTFISIFLTQIATGDPDLKSKNFLIEYGYLDPPKAGSLPEPYSDEVMTTAIKTAQKYGRIPETGVLDNRTIKLFNSQRCGIKDILKPEDYKIKKPWPKKQLTYGFTSFTNSMTKDVVKREISRAFNEWSKVSTLKFSETDDPKNADIEIGFYKGAHGDEFPFDGWKGKLAHAFFPSFGGDMHFDDAEFWDVDPGWFFSLFRVDLYTVAIHELGHSLGLDHSLVEGSIMNPYYVKGGQIGEDDKNAIHALYGSG